MAAGVTLRFKDHSAAFLAALERGQAKALFAAATVIKNAVKRGLRGGYTSGDFTTGHNLRSISISPPEFDGRGTTIRVGTPLLYPLYWEIGHHNIFTRKFERVPIWEPAYLDNRAEAFEAYSRVLKAQLSGTAAASVVEDGD
jgi:hypothetical protein